MSRPGPSAQPRRGGRSSKTKATLANLPQDLPKIRVMISSRAASRVFGDSMTLSEVRQRLQNTLHAIRWHLPEAGAQGQAVGRDQRLFDVWIHEHHSGDRGDRSTLDISIDEIRRADVILALYTGESGSARQGSDLGICHAELLEALARRPEIVALVGIEPITRATEPRDQAFQAYVQSKNLFTPQGVCSYVTLERKIIELLQARVAELATRGARAGRYKLDRGQALDWNRLDLDARHSEMRQALARAVNLAMPNRADAMRLQRVMFNGVALAVQLDAIPAALTNAAARERVGQPFMRDHEQAVELEQMKAPGIVHLIACHRGVTESQALRMLGSPDAMAVASDFGVYALDRIQRVQVLMLAKCSDESSTSIALRRMQEWLALSGEQVKLVAHAKSRRRILQIIHAEARRPIDGGHTRAAAEPIE